MSLVGKGSFTDWTETGGGARDCIESAGYFLYGLSFEVPSLPCSVKYEDTGRKSLGWVLPPSLVSTVWSLPGWLVGFPSLSSLPILSDCFNFCRL